MLRLFTFGLLVAAQSATAQSNGIEFTVGAGAQTAPGYFGDADQDVGIIPSFKFERLRFGSLSIGEGDDTGGLGLHGAFRVVGARDAADFPELTGLETIDASLELGAGLHYAARDYYAYADVRYGVVGHESFVAELGADAFYRPTDQLTFAAGPRVVWGSDDYAQTYFGVSAAAAAASSFDSFDASSGLVSSGLEASATYQFNDDWGVVGTVRYDLLRGDAADSPITASDDQLSVGVVLTRKVTFGF